MKSSVLYIMSVIYSFIMIAAIMLGLLSLESSFLVGGLFLLAGIVMVVLHSAFGIADFMHEYEDAHPLADRMFGCHIDE